MRLELFGTPEVEPVERDRVSVVPAFRVEGLDGVVERLQARGVVFTERGREAWGAYANLHDPDGNLLNLTSPTPDPRPSALTARHGRQRPSSAPYHPARGRRTAA